MLVLSVTPPAMVGPWRFSMTSMNGTTLIISELSMDESAITTAFSRVCPLWMPTVLQLLSRGRVIGFQDTVSFDVFNAANSSPAGCLLPPPRIFVRPARNIRLLNHETHPRQFVGRPAVERLPNSTRGALYRFDPVASRNKAIGNLIPLFFGGVTRCVFTLHRLRS